MKIADKNIRYKCSLCNCKAYADLYQNEAIRYVMCEECSLVSLYPRPTEEEYAHFYEKEYQKHRHKLETYEEAVARLESKGSYDKRKLYLPDLDRYITKQSRVLEIGSGWGVLSRLIQDTYRCEVQSIETGKLQAHVAKKYFKLNVFCGTLNAFMEANKTESYDVIVMTHVLEHLTNPDNALTHINKLLKKNGVLYIAVPNVARPFEPLDRFFHFEHVYYFSPLTLMKLFRKNGLKIVYMNLRSVDIRIAVVKETDKRPEIDTTKFLKKYHGKRIRTILKLQAYKYSFLRIFKQIARAILPREVFNNVRRFVIVILRKLRIIDV